MKFHLETERLILREFRITDSEVMFDLDSNPKVHKYLGNKPVKNKEEALEMIESVINQYKARGIGRWVAIEKSSGEFIGWSGLKLVTEYRLNGFTKFYDIGYRFLPKYWGKGYATESGMAAKHYAFNVLKLPELCASTHIDNQASHYALLKIGLKYIEDFYSEEWKLNLRWYKIKNQ